MTDRESSNRFGRRAALKASAAGVLAAACGRALAKAAEERQSRFGVYSGYSEERFDGWRRTSQYVTVRDGTRIAVDLFRPTRAGKLHTGALPVIWEPKRYQRASIRADGGVRTTLDSDLTDVARFLKHGYVVASVDRRGTGASFGTRNELSDPLDALDGHDVTEWLAKQPWSSGRIGMFGASYEGEMQLRVAGTAPPHLKAIMPEVAPFDWYWIVHTGGVYRSSFKNIGTFVRQLDIDPKNAPVDGDEGHALLEAALALHKAGNDYAAADGALPCRDSHHPVTGRQNWLERHGGHFAEGLSRSGIAVYHRVGWFAGVLVDQLAWYVNQKAGPKKMMIGPWGGRGVPPEAFDLWATEGLRFFDYWLKGIRNGIMDEPPIHSSVPSTHQRIGTEWRGLGQWPLPNEKRAEFFFDGGKSGTVTSANDGRLSGTRPSTDSGKDEHAVRYDLAYGPTKPNLPTDPVAPDQKPQDHAAYDAQGLTYTGDPVAAATEITGHPTARLWVSSTARDGDFFVKLLDVAPDGSSTFISEGALRASHRKIGVPPYDFMGLPWPSSRGEDLQELTPGEPVELRIALSPVSYLLRPGHRLRVTVAGSDTAIAATPVIDPAPVITLHRDRSRSSSITLPVIPA